MKGWSMTHYWHMSLLIVLFHSTMRLPSREKNYDKQKQAEWLLQTIRLDCRSQNSFRTFKQFDWASIDQGLFALSQ
jgi:hypothetical protein